MATMTEIQKFYRDMPNLSGYTLSAVLDWDDDALESVHDWVQWVFPTDQPSAFNPDAPLVQQADIKVFQKDESLKGRLMDAESRFRRFLQLGSPSPFWAAAYNHNLLRITRVIRSLTLLASKQRAEQFRADVLASAAGKPELNESIRYWKRATEE